MWQWRGCLVVKQETHISSSVTFSPNRVGITGEQPFFFFTSPKLIVQPQHFPETIMGFFSPTYPKSLVSFHHLKANSLHLSHPYLGCSFSIMDLLRYLYQPLQSLPIQCFFHLCKSLRFKKVSPEDLGGEGPSPFSFHICFYFAASFHYHLILTITFSLRKKA